MDIAGTAVGIASLGIQVCQGLLLYYDQWKDYNKDVTATFQAIDDLSKTLTLLLVSLEDKTLDQEKKDCVTKCLQSCEDALGTLSKKAEKLLKKEQPEGLAQRIRFESQRLLYPFRASTLAKLQETVVEVQMRLQTALQVLQLGVGQSTQEVVVRLDQRTSDIEGRINAVQRSSQYMNITNWLSAPDPWSNHQSARQAHEPQTGAWLLQLDDYKRWKTGAVQHLALIGKPGCGKTILCATVIEDIRAHCFGRKDAHAAAFFFTFSDEKKQTYESLLRSLVVQLGWREPGLALLQQAYEQRNYRAIGQDGLENILIASAKTYTTVYLMLDALDESLDERDIRYTMLEGVARLAQSVPPLKIFATSRNLYDVREAMNRIQAKSIPIETYMVDIDIMKYVSRQLTNDKRLSKLNKDTKDLIEITISHNSDGMFRWAYCLLLEIKQVKWMKSEYIVAALKKLPKTLDETYRRILINIEEQYRQLAINLLQWLTFSRSPLNLAELAAAANIHLSQEGDRVDDRWDEDLQGLFNVVPGLITIVTDGDRNSRALQVERGISPGGDAEPAPDDFGLGNAVRQYISPASKVRLAHFSVKEYLESTRIKESDARQFYLGKSICDDYLAQSCLSYLLHYSANATEMTRKSDKDFPLLKYAAKSWFVHMSQADSSDETRAVILLGANDVKSDWLVVHDPEPTWNGLSRDDAGSSVYFASLFGLNNVATLLIEGGAEVNAEGGDCGNALQAASSRGHNKVVQMLLNAGAEVNAQGGKYGNALQAASFHGYCKVVEILLNAGANVNMEGGQWGSALQAASTGGHDKVVQMLLNADAEVNMQGGGHDNALQIASELGFDKVIQMLLKAGAEVNTQARFYDNALQAASYRGHNKIVQMLLNAGAEVNAQGGLYGSALEVASLKGHDEVVEILLKAGAEVIAQRGFFEIGLQNPSLNKTIKMLSDANTEVNLHGGYYDNALQAASFHGYDIVVQMLLNAGAAVDAQGGGPCGNALQSASFRGYEKLVQMLLNAGADVNAQGGYYGNALEAATSRDHKEVVQILLDAGAINEEIESEDEEMESEEDELQPTRP